MQVPGLGHATFGGTILTLSSHIFILGVEQESNGESLSYEYISENANVTDLSGHYWRHLDNRFVNQIDRTSLLIPYLICENCLKEGFD